MFKVLQRIASLKVTLTGMVLLGIGAGLSYDNPMNTPVWVLVLPLAWLAINLVCAIITNTRINQQPGLLLFHVCLLMIVLLAGIGRLTHLDSHIELPLGEAFRPDRLMDVQAGPLHHGDVEGVHFIQGPYTVQYDANLKRGLTHSQVKVQEINGQWQDKVVGDDRPLVINGYRFYTTHNKGFTCIVTWLPDPSASESVAPQTGTINMPSYPLYEYKQDNEWTTPAGQTVKFWLQLNTGMTLEKPWVLDGRTATGVLVVTDKEQRRELKPGEAVQLEGGRLRFDALSTWMGYRVFYDPTLHWLFVVAIMGVLGLAHYFWRKMNLQPWESPIEQRPQATGGGDSRAPDASNQLPEGQRTAFDNIMGNGAQPVAEAQTMNNTTDTASKTTTSITNKEASIRRQA